MMEGIVRPFTDRGVTPVPFTKPGAQQNRVVRLAIGYSGSIKTMGSSQSATLTTKMGQIHNEKPPTSSAALQSAMAAAAGG
jgi:hypothetical protein